MSIKQEDTIQGTFHQGDTSHFNKILLVDSVWQMQLQELYMQQCICTHKMLLLYYIISIYGYGNLIVCTIF